MRNIKRGLIGLVTLAMLTFPNMTKAHGWGHLHIINRNVDPIRTRTRHSPYALTHENPSGLISGHKEYSPYVFPKNQGIEDRNIRWSPYAFNSKTKTGLINEDSHPSHNPFLCHIDCCSPIIFGNCWPITHQKPTQPYQTPTKAEREQKLDKQKNSKIPMSDYAKYIEKDLIKKGVNYIRTKDKENFILPDEWIILQSPESKINLKDYKGFSVIKLTTK